MSARVVLDLLHEFTNTIVISLFHNRMWQSKDPDFVLAFHFSPLWTNGVALRLMNSMDSIPADKVLKMTHLYLQKRFPIYHVSQMLGGPSLRLGDAEECLKHSFRYRMRWE